MVNHTYLHTVSSIASKRKSAGPVQPACVDEGAIPNAKAEVVFNRLYNLAFEKQAKEQRLKKSITLKDLEKEKQICTFSP